MKTIYFITSNANKLAEAKAKISDLDIKIIQKNIGYPEVQADTLEKVVTFGARYIQEKINHPFLIEDAGLFIKYLHGFPGVYSSYVFHTLGCKGILKLINALEIDRRKACFKSVFAYIESNEKPQFFIGKCKGKISTDMRGNNGFGYDPIFIPDGNNKTFAEMDINEKNSYSHRGKSLDKIREFFKNY
jgi:XTP/dITP diphosphohydrolase